jgi:hypothetical protein
MANRSLSAFNSPIHKTIYQRSQPSPIVDAILEISFPRRYWRRRRLKDMLVEYGRLRIKVFG